MIVILIILLSFISIKHHSINIVQINVYFLFMSRAVFFYFNKNIQSIYLYLQQFSVRWQQ